MTAHLQEGKFECSLRRADQSDAEAIAAHRYFQAKESKADLAAYAEWLGSRVTAGQYLGWLAEVEGSIIAGLGLLLLDWGPTRGQVSSVRGRIVNVYTAPTWRRKGIARSLLKEAMAECQNRAVPMLTLGATNDSIDLYSSMGFEKYEAEMRWSSANEQ